MISCPFCEGQGLIYKAKVKEKKEIIFICDECDTIWHDKIIREDNCDNLNDFMKNLGKKALWDELEELEML